MNSTFLHDFLMISEFRTVLFLAVFGAMLLLVRILEKRKASFSTRVLVATGLGLILGLAVQYVAGFPADPGQYPFVRESTKWLGLVGNGFIALIRMLVIPLVMVSIVQVIVTMQGADLGRLTRLTVITSLVMVVVSAVVGLALAMAFGLGSGAGPVIDIDEAQIKTVQPVADTLLSLLPSNPIAAMVETNIIALVIFAAFFGAAARRMAGRYPEIIKPFTDLIAALHKIIVSVAMYVIRLMPYAVVAMLANTVAGRGIQGIREVLLFIGVLYLGLLVQFAIQLAALGVFGLSPLPFLRKGLDTFVMAFTSRSSVGTLPMTISTLTGRMGVSDGTANFVASFGTTAGMQGCAGVFPAMLIVFVSNLSGSPMDLTFLVMSVIVITIGSLGIAGIPGTATMAASVALSGTGMARLFPLVSPILAIDPIIDMGRSCLNVTGSMVNSLIVDKRLGMLDVAEYNDTSAAGLSDDTGEALPA